MYCSLEYIIVYVMYCCCSYATNAMDIAATVNVQDKGVSHFYRRKQKKAPE